MPSSPTCPSHGRSGQSTSGTAQKQSQVSSPHPYWSSELMHVGNTRGPPSQQAPPPLLHACMHHPTAVSRPRPRWRSSSARRWAATCSSSRRSCPPSRPPGPICSPRSSASAPCHTTRCVFSTETPPPPTPRCPQDVPPHASQRPAHNTVALRRAAMDSSLRMPRTEGQRRMVGLTCDGIWLDVRCLPAHSHTRTSTTTRTRRRAQPPCSAG